jgi:Leucine-rich repeat (LRR) protein
MLGRTQLASAAHQAVVPIAAVCACYLSFATTMVAAEPPTSLGRATGAAFRDVPNPVVSLAGLNLHLFSNNGKMELVGIEPIYRSGGDTFASRMYGKDGEVKRIEARAGYAIGAIMGQTSDRPVGLRLVFMRETETGLDPQDSYQSRWFGLHSSSPELKLGGDGRRIVGLHGHTAKTLNSLGCVFAGEESLESPTSPTLTSGARLDPTQAVIELRKIGARITMDEKRPGKPVTAVDLSGLQIGVGQLAPMRVLTELEELNMSETRSDAEDLGLENLAGLTKLHKLELRRAYPLNRTGIAHLRGLKNLRYLTMSHLSVSDRGLAELRDMADLEVLETSGSEITDVGMQQIARCKKLQTLVLHYTSVGDEGVRALSSCPDLTYLSLQGSQITDAGLAAIGTLTGLERLVLTDSPVPHEIKNARTTSDGLRHLARLTRLKQLSLGGYELDVSDEGLRHLRGLKNLTSLTVILSKLTSDGLSTLRDMSKLEFLNLSHNPEIDDGGLVFLEELPALSTLELIYTQIGDDGLTHLKKIKPLQRLRLTHTQITDAGLKHLAELSNLQELGLSQTACTDAGLPNLQGLNQLQSLALESTQIRQPKWNSIQGLTNLENLRLGRTPLTDEGLKDLQQFKNLQILSLYDTRITDKGLAHLSGMRQLKQIDLAGTNISDDGLALLKDLTDLEEINLGATAVTDVGLEYLKGMPGLRVIGLNETIVSDKGVGSLESLANLSKIYLFRTRVSKQAVQKLQRTLPQLQVIRQWSGNTPDPRP